jgi:membrane-associated phospholipid phosphatase
LHLLIYLLVLNGLELLASLSLVVGLSRVYVGVHFPFDVVGSFLIGFF